MAVKRCSVLLLFQRLCGGMRLSGTGRTAEEFLITKMWILGRCVTNSVLIYPDEPLL